VAEIVCWNLANKGKIFGLERERKAARDDKSFLLLILWEVQLEKWY
jgi:hypothetical protein